MICNVIGVYEKSGLHEGFSHADEFFSESDEHLILVQHGVSAKNKNKKYLLKYVL